MDDRTAHMKHLRQEIVNLTESPLYEYRVENNYFPVIGQGSHHAKIMIIGEAPGENEAKTGRPFCGASGKVLDELLERIELKREDVYVTNIVKDRPPKNRDPNKKEINLYAPFLKRQIDIIQPRVLVTLGRFSMEFVLALFDADEKDQKITDLHGKTIKVKTDYGEAHVIPMYHPAFILRSPNQKPIMVEDFKALRPFLS
jgi:DNA polymerase